MTTPIAPTANGAFTGNERERLILEHMPQVKLIAWKIAQRLGPHGDYDDLVSIGVVGLIAAIDNFDPARNVKLKTYAEYKIKGAILDSLRSADSATRRERLWAQQIEQASVRLQQRLKRLPTHTETAAEVGLTSEQYTRACEARAGAVPVSLDNPRCFPNTNWRGTTYGETQSPTTSHDCPGGYALGENLSPEETVAEEELKQIVLQVLQTLPPTQQRVVELHYAHGLPLSEVAPLLNLTRWEARTARQTGIDALRHILSTRWNIACAEPVAAQATLL